MGAREKGDSLTILSVPEIAKKCGTDEKRETLGPQARALGLHSL